MNPYPVCAFQVKLVKQEESSMQVRPELRSMIRLVRLNNGSREEGKQDSLLMVLVCRLCKSSLAVLTPLCSCAWDSVIQCFAKLSFLPWNVLVVLTLLWCCPQLAPALWASQDPLVPLDPPDLPDPLDYQVSPLTSSTDTLVLVLDPDPEISLNTWHTNSNNLHPQTMYQTIMDQTTIWY